MFDLIPAAIRNFIDSIFAPPISFLQMCLDYLNSIALIAGHGINLNNYFGVFAYLPTAFQSVINSLLASIIFLAILQLVKAILRMYFTVKSGVKWW